MSGPVDWTIAYLPGAICRTVMWQGKEVALINPRGDFTDAVEADLAAGIAHAGRMHALLKIISTDLAISEGRSISPHCREELAAILASVERIDTGTYREMAEEDEDDDTEGEPA